MTEQQNHLSNVMDQQKKLIQEIQELDREIMKRKETALKLQGIIEYLTDLGVTLPETDDTQVNELSEDPEI